MKRIVLLLTTGLLLCTATAAHASPGDVAGKHSESRGHRPHLTRSDARNLMAVALDRRFSSWAAGYAYRFKCVRRINRVRIRCMKIQWVVGDIEYRGTGSIWLTRHGTFWNYSYRIIRTDTYCLYTGGSNCTKKFVVK